ncbi:MAG TPA: F0F1 ATP synthase subunit gamma, partial [Gammaproteobacteria bacterium]
MGRYRTLENHLKQLRELQSIIASMKTLAQLELHKLGAFTPTQHAMADGLQQMADDFLHFYPQGSAHAAGTTVWLLLGSERGFCGDFNGGLLH